MSAATPRLPGQFEGRVAGAISPVRTATILPRSLPQKPGYCVAGFSAFHRISVPKVRNPQFVSTLRLVVRGLWGTGAFRAREVHHHLRKAPITFISLYLLGDSGIFPHGLQNLCHNDSAGGRALVGHRPQGFGYVFSAQPAIEGVSTESHSRIASLDEGREEAYA
jgi:hypothetical protein